MKTKYSRNKLVRGSKKDEVSEQFGISAYITRNFVNDARHMALL